MEKQVKNLNSYIYVFQVGTLNAKLGKVMSKADLPLLPATA
jgi:hypothetical protein